eukprot:CAMPEP_0185211030 /NCGR_PEP_ID=MMETSP1140-20130426/66792_1 /TAXON_ID=298111 /ORGANISM="Pavlova sp., Strain CCMP459" /LENGTH=176 /DNA_ID=CAMNT_0027778869 /DNA_START=1 /DNA_END=527 /DNA_ORIENTATION=+
MKSDRSGRAHEERRAGRDTGEVRASTTRDTETARQLPLAPSTDQHEEYGFTTTTDGHEAPPRRAVAEYSAPSSHCGSDSQRSLSGSDAGTNCMARGSSRASRVCSDGGTDMHVSQQGSVRSAVLVHSSGADAHAVQQSSARSSTVVVRSSGASDHPAVSEQASFSQRSFAAAGVNA